MKNKFKENIMFNKSTSLFAAALTVASINLSVFTSPVFAEEVATSTCEIVVCDLTIKREELLNADQNVRGSYGIKLMNKYEGTKDIAILKNLVEIGNMLKDLAIELDDDDWVKRSGPDLINSVLLSLGKYSEIESNNLSHIYKSLEDQNARNLMIEYWSSKLSKIEDLNKLEALIVFGQAANTISLENGDDSWVARATDEFVSKATIKLIALDPMHEGLYDVEITAATTDAFFAFNKVVVLDSSSTKNLMVVFINTKFRRVVYSYSNAVIEGSKMKGKFLSADGLKDNVFEMALNRATGEVTGSIETTTDQFSFTGSQAFTTRDIFAGSTPSVLSNTDVIGTMTGSLAGMKGKLTIKSFQPGIYSATFKSTNGYILMNFKGKFFAKNGVLSLTSNNKIKLTLAYRTDDKGVAAWRGASFSTITGTSQTAVFTK
jgi:hypothetical protein